MNRSNSFAHSAAAVVFRLALVLGLVLAVWSVYRGLPQDDGAVFGSPEQPEATALRVRLRRAPNSAQPGATVKVPVQLYPVNVAAVRREFDSERRPGVRFEDFMTKRMGARQPVTGALDESGEAVLAVPPGRWWVHVTLEGAEEITWRLPVNVSGREKVVELNTGNAYTKAKRF